MTEDELEIDYEETLKDKEKEIIMIEERLKTAENYLENLTKLWNSLDSNQSNNLLKFLKTKEKQNNFMKKRIIVGNTSQFISDKKREVHDSYTHKWMLYVRGTREEPDISGFVKKVRIFLHSSFAPNDIVDIHHPPFHLSRRGYGEFQVTVQLHFKGNTDVNKPIDIVHALTLDQNNTGRVCNSSETVVDIELDKNALNEADTEDLTKIKRKKKKKLIIDSDEEIDGIDVIHVKSNSNNNNHQEINNGTITSPSKKKRKGNKQNSSKNGSDKVV
ncbi:hypothetical protein ABK040_015668 [Willaertia magna]